MKKRSCKIQAIIPARGGSKGVVRKNICLMDNLPLINYTIRAADHSQFIDQVFVTTDDLDIKNISQNLGANIIERPAYLATDTASTIDVVLHCLEHLDGQNIEMDIIILLQPTSPLRTTEDIDNSIEIFLNGSADSVISVSESQHPPYWSCVVNQDQYLEAAFGEKYFQTRRQDLKKTYMPNGAIYVATPGYVKNNRSFFGKKTLPYIMPRERSVDIDSEEDFILAEMLLRKKNVSKDEMNSSGTFL